MTFKSFRKLLINCITANHPQHKRTQINRICVGRTRAKIFCTWKTEQKTVQSVLPPCAGNNPSLTAQNMHVYNALIHPEGQKNGNWSSFSAQVKIFLAVVLRGSSFQMLPVEQNRKCHSARSAPLLSCAEGAERAGGEILHSAAICSQLWKEG